MNTITVKKNSPQEKSAELLDISQAGAWASAYLNRSVTNSNISYLINYGKIPVLKNTTKGPFIKKEDLINYYKSFLSKKRNFFVEKARLNSPTES